MRMRKFRNPPNYLMKLELFNEIVAYLHDMPSRKVLPGLEMRFPTTEKRTLGSIAAQEYQRKMKRIYPQHHTPEAKEAYYERYMDMIKHSDVPGRLTRLADSVDLSPCLMARLILEQYLLKKNESATRQQISRLLKDSTLIDHGKLSVDVHLCVLQDDNYGPIADAIRHSIGYEYEFKLKKLLRDLAVPFICEEDLRKRGYDKTPDTKLEVPIVVNGHVVNWIESKASFGDVQNHETYLRDQFWSYQNRFGSGMVIYWFGYVDELDVHGDCGILLSAGFPKDIIKMDPDVITSNT